VKSVTLNGRPLGGFVLRHAEILSGGELIFEMDSRTVQRGLAEVEGSALYTTPAYWCTEDLYTAAGMWSFSRACPRHRVLCPAGQWKGRRGEAN